MRLKQLLDGIKITEVYPRGISLSDVNVSGISTDSAGTLPGDVFVCIKGTHTDGHLYAADAVKRGAAAIITERYVLADVPQLITENTRSAAAYMWNSFYGDPAGDMTLLAVTGTNGKTSVSFMIREILLAAGISCGMIGTIRCMAGERVLNCGGGSEMCGAAAAMTTPDPGILYGMLREMRDSGITHVVMEASSHALALHKLDPISADIAVFTGLSPEHLDFHGTMDNYLSAKSALFRSARKGIINADSPYAERLMKMTAVDFVKVGADPLRTGEYGLWADNVERSPGHVRYRFCGRGNDINISCAMPGRFGLYNSLLASAACLEAGVMPSVIEDALGKFSGVPGRMETLVRYGGLRVMRDFAHTPDALLGALRIAKEETGDGRLWVLFGCGGDRDKMKRPEMGRIASEKADFTVITSDNCRNENRDSIIADIMKGFDKTKPHAVIPDREEAVRFAVMTADAGDTVLLCGKGHEDYEITSEGIRPFDEAKIVLSAIEERRLRETDK